MAAPEKYVDYEFLDDGLNQDIQWSSPVIGGVTAATNLNANDAGISGGWLFEWPATAGALYGARKVFPAVRDVSSRRFVWASGFTNQYATVLKFADLADGGLRFYLTDSAGAYNGWTIYGRDISGGNPNPAYGFGSFFQFNNSLEQMWWCIDLDRTPDYSSGTLDLTDIVAVEVHVQNHATITNTVTGRFACGYICASDEPIIRAGEVADPADFSLLRGSLAQWNITNNLFYPGGARQAQSLTPTFDGSNGQIYNTVAPIHVGDGSTATYFRQGRGQLATQMSLDTIAYRIAQGETPELLGPYLPAASGRTHTINQSASDDVQIADFTWSGYDNPDRVYAFEVKGSASGSCSILRNSFFRADFVKLAHAQTEDCLFDACNGVEITADTGMTGATIRNAPSGTTALTIAGAAGDYSAIEARLNNPAATYDIALGAGGAGTYDLSGLTVPTGYTLKLRNNSATNAVTVTIAAGITTSTSTAGGTITIAQPPTTYTLEMPNVIDGSRVQIYNVTADAELTNALVSGGSGFSAVYTSGVDYTSGDVGRYRIAYQSGVTAKEYIEGTFTFTATTTVNSLPLTQTDQAAYNLNGQDGSLVTGISWDSGNLQIDINDDDNTLAMQNIVAWYYYFITTATGIDEAFGGIDWEALNQARINVDAVDIKLDNVKATPLKIQDGRLYRSDGTTIIGGTGSIQVDPDPVYVKVINTTGTPVITGDINDVPAKVQQGMTTQGYTENKIDQVLSAARTAVALSA